MIGAVILREKNESHPHEKPNVSEKKAAKAETIPESKIVMLKSKSGSKNKKTIRFSHELVMSLNYHVVLKIMRKDKKSKKTDSGVDDDDWTPNQAGAYKGKQEAKAELCVLSFPFRCFLGKNIFASTKLL